MESESKMIEIEGFPIQIIKFNEITKKFELNSALQNILCSDEVKNCPIAVISIAGGLRRGKSFLLSFLLRYLQAEYVNNDSKNWMGNDNIPLNGFKWRGGCEMETAGIWIWSKIFTKVLQNGEKIGVMLIDSQGTFDSNTEMKENIALFSLTTLFSSLQIYNLFSNIQEDDLQHLQLFTEYGKSAMDKTWSEKPFQNLLFLIRDWRYTSDYDFGAAGGRQFLMKKLQTNNNQRSAQSNIRNDLLLNFESLKCFLMPHPGKNVENNISFDGKLKDIDDEFKEILNKFVPSILSPEIVVLKKINGNKICAGYLSQYIYKYWETYNKNDVIVPRNICEITVEANVLTVKNEATGSYNNKMSREIVAVKKSLDISEVIEIHNSAFKDAIDIFNMKVNIGDEIIREGHRNDLKEWISNQLAFYLIEKDNKKTNEFQEVIDKLNNQLMCQQNLITEYTDLIKNLQSELDKKKKNVLQKIVCSYNGNAGNSSNRTPAIEFPNILGSALALEYHKKN